MIHKVFEASTGNIEEFDSKVLEKEIRFTVGKYEEGFIIYLPAKEVGLREHHKGYSDAFQNLILLAQGVGCRYLCLDRDADYVPGLPSFDW